MEYIQSDQVQTFVNVTGASEAEARQKLQAFKGNIDAAIDSYFSDRENFVSPLHIEELDALGLISQGESQSRHNIPSQSFPRSSLPRSLSRRLSNIRVVGPERSSMPHFPYQGTSPFVSEPRDIREIPIEWKDEQPRVRSGSAGLVIEEIPATSDTLLSSQFHPHIVSDEDDSSMSRSNNTEPWSLASNMDLNGKHRSVDGPWIDDITDAMFKSEDADSEEEILRSVIEESKKETSRKGFSKSSGDVRVLESPLDAEDTDLAQAISLSLKTAEQERAWRESGDCLFFAESDRLQDDTESDAHLRRRNTHLMRQSSCGNLETSTNLLASDDMIPGTSVNSVDAVVRDSTEEAEGFEGQLLQRRRSKKILKYPLCSNTHGTEQLVNQDDDSNLASLLASRGEEEGADYVEEIHCRKDVDVKVAADAKGKLQTQEDLKKVEAANQSVLPEEPPVDSDCAVTIMVRLPNGARQIRRFRESEPLQCLFDFIDISCGVCSGSYQLVSSHPRRAFSSAEGGTIFQELGLNSKYETLFLEML